MPEDSVSPASGAAQISIREAQASDVDDLAELEAIAFKSDRISRRSFASLARSASAALLAAYRGRDLLGYALVLFRRGSRSARLYSIAVAPAAARTGLGGSLLQAAEAAALARGADRLALEVRVDNADAIRLYDRAGFKLLGQRENYYSDGAAALRYARELSGPARSSRPALGRAA